MSEDGKKRIFDKIIMGAVIGGAIGSVVGASIRKRRAGEPVSPIEEEKTKKGLWWAIKTFLRRRKMKKLLKEYEELKQIPEEKY